MSRVLVVCEGHGELIFLRYMVQLFTAPNKVSYSCHELRSKKWQPVPYPHKAANEEIEIVFLTPGNDEQVLSTIRDRYKGFTREYYWLKGYVFTRV